jgi:hypothetical protein
LDLAPKNDLARLVEAVTSCGCGWGLRLLKNHDETMGIFEFWRLCDYLPMRLDVFIVK